MAGLVTNWTWVNDDAVATAVILGMYFGVVAVIGLAFYWWWGD